MSSHLKPVAIVGAGGHGREVLDIIEAMNAESPSFEVVGFIDDGRTPGTMAVPHEVPVLGGIGVLRDMKVAYVPAIGHCATRRRIVQSLPDHETVDLIHPSATKGSHVTHGPGVIMAAGARLTHAIALGQHVHLNVNASVSHDCTIGDFVTITPGAHLSGSVTLGDEVWLGVGSSVIQGVSVGHGSIVGAGAAVIHDVAAGSTVGGVPAHELTPTRGLR